MNDLALAEIWRYGDMEKRKYDQGRLTELCENLRADMRREFMILLMGSAYLEGLGPPLSILVITHRRFPS